MAVDTTTTEQRIVEGRIADAAMQSRDVTNINTSVLISEEGFYFTLQSPTYLPQYPVKWCVI